jgi:hypothetical protein
VVRSGVRVVGGVTAAEGELVWRIEGREEALEEEAAGGLWEVVAERVA